MLHARDPESAFPPNAQFWTSASSASPEARLREQEELQEGIAALVAVDAQILGVCHRALASEVATLDDAAIDGRLAELKDRARAEAPGAASALCFLALEERRLAFGE